MSQKKMSQKKISKKTILRIQAEFLLQNKGWNISEVGKDLRCSRDLVRDVKNRGAQVKRKQRNDKGISKTIDRKIGKKLKKELKGKKIFIFFLFFFNYSIFFFFKGKMGVGIKKLAKNIN